MRRLEPVGLQARPWGWRLWQGFSAAWAVAALVAALWSASSAGQTPEEAAELTRRAELLAQKLAKLTQEAATLEDRRQQLEAELAIATLREKEGEAQAQLAALAVQEASQRLKQLEAQVQQKRSQLSEHLATLWALRRAVPELVLLLPWGEPEEFVRLVTRLLALLAYHRQQLETVEEMARQQAQALAELSQKQEIWRRAQEEAARRRVVLAATRHRVLAELARLEAQRRQEAMALSQVEEALARLERLWGTVTRAGQPFEGRVRLLKGGLPWPAAEARVLRGFGRYRDPRYATVVLHPGWDLEVPPGTEVKAVAPGKVVYAQFFKSWGNLVIVAHGDDLYTLYGRLATMFASGGQRVAMGEALGLAGPLGPNGNMYFEVRNGTKAQDPAGWLRPAEAR